MLPSPLSIPINDFSLTTFRDISTTHAVNQNVFMSPFGIMTALSMLMLGSRSQTEQQLRHGLRFDQVDGNYDVHRLFQVVLMNRYNKDPNLKLSNYILVPISKTQRSADLLSKYANKVHEYYAADMEDVDYRTEGLMIMQKVNNWINSRTNGMIKQIIESPPDPMTKLMLLNSIYFKGKWKQPFDKELTHTDVFHNADGSISKTEFMKKSESRLMYTSGKVSGQRVSVVELPYNENNISMIIFVPDQMNALSRIVKGETFASDVNSIISSLAKLRGRTSIDLYLPKFKLEEEYEMTPLLNNMGITDVFNNNADLSGMNGQHDLYASEVKHKAVIKVDEEGTEAAAVTSISVRTLSFSPDVRADHPFFFTIIDRASGIMLFVGAVNKF
jgi:serpin B